MCAARARFPRGKVALGDALGSAPRKNVCVCVADRSTIVGLVIGPMTHYWYMVGYGILSIDFKVQK